MSSEKTEGKATAAEVLGAAEELTALVKTTREYRRYKKYLEKLRAQEEVYERLNGFRAENMALQLGGHDESYYGRLEELHAKYKDVLMESAVMDFLGAEQSVCSLLRKMYGHIAAELNLDMAYMERIEQPEEPE